MVDLKSKILIKLIDLGRGMNAISVDYWNNYPNFISLINSYRASLTTLNQFTRAIMDSENHV